MKIKYFKTFNGYGKKAWRKGKKLADVQICKSIGSGWLTIGVGGGTVWSLKGWLKE
jgi:hypothetical protein